MDVLPPSLAPISRLISPSTKLPWPLPLPCRTVADGVVEGGDTHVSVLRRPALTKLRSPSSSFPAPPRRHCVSAASPIYHQISRIDSIVLTHEHADAILGLDVVRSLQPISPTNGVAQFSWNIIAEDCNQSFFASGLKLTPLPVIHGEDYIRLGFLFGDKSKVAYLSDVSWIPATTEYVAIVYSATAALPFGTILVIVLIWTLVTSPLLVLGGIAGKNSKAEFQAPIRTTKYPREIPPLP
ncbi:hypothetical protein PIB30_093500 [Stylosanthes scabra]|uniref:Metallo-beta-lactamase domain-containing protein n=1 Tax=Stylosanthes scabra TaxID=79078 RepID=A0ABU6TUR5_9FABA|nr:hypothetical protein [Stylosanthes scabra]